MMSRMWRKTINIAIIDRPCKHEHDRGSKVLAFEVQVIECWIFKLLIFGFQLYMKRCITLLYLTMLLIAKSLVFFRSFSTSLKGSQSTLTSLSSIDILLASVQLPLKFAISRSAKSLAFWRFSLFKIGY